MQDYGLQDIHEARRAVRHLISICPDAIPGLAVDFAQQPGLRDASNGQAVYLYRAAIREATQGEG